MLSKSAIREILAQTYSVSTMLYHIYEHNASAVGQAEAS